MAARLPAADAFHRPRFRHLTTLLECCASLEGATPIQNKPRFRRLTGRGFKHEGNSDEQKNNP